MGTLTKRLAQAVARARELPADEQDALAEALFEQIESAGETHLSPEQIDEVKRIQEGLRTGTTRLASDEEVEETWHKFGG